MVNNVSDPTLCEEAKEYDQSITRDELYKFCNSGQSRPLSIISESLELQNIGELAALLTENVGFMVIGVIGRKDTGKSTILNVLNGLSTAPSDLNKPFSVKSFSVSMNMEDFVKPQTVSIEIFITSDRVILIDTFPVLSTTMLPWYFSSDLVRDQASLVKDHAWSELVSLRVVAWLFNISHVVVAVQDDPRDISFNRFIDLAVSLRPSCLLQSEFPQNDSSHAQHLAKLLERKHEKCKERQDDSEENYDDCVGENDVDFALRSAQAHEELSQLPDTNVTKSSEVRNQSYFSSSAADEKNLISELAGIGPMLNYLQNAKLYSASLIHVVNMVPDSFFIQSQNSEIDRFKRILNMIYTSSFRLATQMKVGPHLLRTHLNHRAKEAHKAAVSRMQNVKRNSDALEAASSASPDNGDNPSHKSSSEEISQGGASTEFSPLSSNREPTAEDLAASAAEDKPLCADTLKGEDLITENRVETEDAIVSECLRSIELAQQACLTTCASEYEQFNDQFIEPHNGEEMKAQLQEMSDCVNRLRNQHLDPEKSVSHNRVFLLPEFDEEGRTGPMSPSFEQCAEALKLAILSTPREHMMAGLTEKKWLEFAQSMWKVAVDSPILQDLHTLTENE